MKFKSGLDVSHIIWSPYEARPPIRRAAVVLSKAIKSSIKKRGAVSSPGDSPNGKTGTYRRSIGIKTLVAPRLGYRVGARRGGPKRSDGFYAHFLEFSTVNMKARPAIAPALEKQETKIEALLVEAAASGVKVKK